MRDAEIEVVPYNPAWPSAFVAERDLLQAVLKPWLKGEIEHVGSTAVPGLAAKPIIDVLAPVESLEQSVGAIVAAVAAGYAHYPYKPEVMHWFCKPSPEVRTHHLHLVLHGSNVWVERLAFRDALRQDEALRSEYARLKLQLARQFKQDREAYTEAKGPFILAVLEATRGKPSAA
jgi:GrpB-like predicted nucleotidyltransferase (UPF0157 family)